MRISDIFRAPPPPPPPPPPKPKTGERMQMCRSDGGEATASAYGDSAAPTIDRDMSAASGANRLSGGGGDIGREPWGQQGQGVYSNGCVSSMFVQEWRAQRPDEFRAAAADLRETGEVEVNGQTIKLSDDRRQMLEEKGLMDSDEAVVEVALHGTVRANTGCNAEGGTDADGVAFLENTLQLGVKLSEGDDASVGDYVAVGDANNKHFMKVTGSGSDGLHLQDAYGNVSVQSKGWVADHGHVDDGDNLGAGTVMAASGSYGNRPPRYA